MKENFYITSDNKTTEVVIEDGTIASVDSNVHCVSIDKDNDADEYMVNYDGKKHFGEIVSLKQNHCTVVMNGNTYTFVIQSEAAYQRSQIIESSNVQSNLRMSAPLPGLICDILVAKDQEVKKGEPLLILEAMKMQNEILSPATGKITVINIHKGDNVMKDQIMLEISLTK